MKHLTKFSFLRGFRVFLLYLSVLTGQLFSSEFGTLIVTYQTNQPGERLDRMRFWLIDEHNERTLYPKKNEFVVNNHTGNERTVVITHLPIGAYSIRFLIPNTDHLFESVPVRTVRLESGEVVKVDQTLHLRNLRPATDIPSPAEAPEVEEESPSSEIVAETGSDLPEKGFDFDPASSGSKKEENAVFLPSIDPRDCILLRPAPLRPPFRFSEPHSASGTILSLATVRNRKIRLEPEAPIAAGPERKGSVRITTDLPDARFTLLSESGVPIGEGTGMNYIFANLDPGRYEIVFSHTDPTPSVRIPKEEKLAVVDHRTVEIKVNFRRTGTLAFSVQEPMHISLNTARDNQEVLNEIVTGQSKPFSLPEGHYLLKYRPSENITDENEKSLYVTIHPLLPGNIQLL